MINPSFWLEMFSFLGPETSIFGSRATCLGSGSIKKIDLTEIFDFPAGELLACRRCRYSAILDFLVRNVFIVRSRDLHFYVQSVIFWVRANKKKIDLTEIFDSPNSELLGPHWCRNTAVVVLVIKHVLDLGVRDLNVWVQSLIFGVRVNKER